MGRDYKFFVRIKCRDPPTCRSFLLHFSAKKVIKHPLHSSAISSFYALKLQENVDSLTRLDLSDSTKEGTKKNRIFFIWPASQSPRVMKMLQLESLPHPERRALCVRTGFIFDTMSIVSKASCIMLKFYNRSTEFLL